MARKIKSMAELIAECKARPTTSAKVIPGGITINDENYDVWYCEATESIGLRARKIGSEAYQVSCDEANERHCTCADWVYREDVLLEAGRRCKHIEALDVTYPVA